jgi:glycosyltransferase involved in cell wall biosynthesis
VAQHRANKNIPLALKVFDELVREKKLVKQTCLLVVGNRGPETTAIKSLIKERSLERKVKLIDGVTDGELRWLYANCIFLMAPSSMEGFGLPVAEGLLCGTRVVCSDIPAFREIGGDACHYFDLHAESAVSAMVAAACNALIERAKPAKNLERFFPENIAKEYGALYGQLREEARDGERMTEG